MQRFDSQGQSIFCYGCIKLHPQQPICLNYTNSFYRLGNARACHKTGSNLMKWDYISRSVDSFFFPHSAVVTAGCDRFLLMPPYGYINLRVCVRLPDHHPSPPPPL
nr:hypothetical protein BgiMline_020231 [Biomphalaria glabrata]